MRPIKDVSDPRLALLEQEMTAGMVGLAPNWVRLDPKLDKSGAFLDQISVHLSNLGSNLTHFGAHGWSDWPQMVKNPFFFCFFLSDQIQYILSL